MKTSIKSICAAFAATIAVSVFAAVPSSITQFVPQTINYQGYLANPSTGVPYTNGIYNLDIRLYRSQSGGTAIWGARYSVYVKDGYFNVMLGESGTSIYSTPSGSSATTYGPTYLWKALWNDTSVSQNYNLWLGVTPREDFKHASIANPTEIAPRQQLLAAPYAFRTQSAYYAERAYDGFTVPGTLTVSGGLSFPSTYSFNGISYNSSTMKIAGTSQTSSNPDLYLYGDRTYLYSGRKIEMKPQAGNIEMTVGDAYQTKVSGGTIVVNNKSTSMTSSGFTYVKGGGLKLQSTASVYLEPAESSRVYGQGTLNWMVPNGTGSFNPPFKFMELKRASFGVYTYIERDYDYNWTVVGFNHHVVGGSSRITRLMVERTVDSSSVARWYLYVEKSGGSEEDTIDVQLLGVSKAFSNDTRTFKYD